MKNWEKLQVRPCTPIIEVMKVIDEGAVQIALVVDDQQRLLGTVTDGDIRRGILRNVSLEDPVEKVMNTNPVVLKVSDSKSKYKTFLQYRLRQIPVVNEQNQVLDIKLFGDFAAEEVDNWVVLMAGGLGTRLRPLTLTKPKPMLEIGGKPILETIIENFMEHGFSKFILSVNYKSEIIKHYFGDGSKLGVSIQYIDEHKRMGTAGSLSLLPEKPTKPFFVMNADLLTKVNFKQLLDFHYEHEAFATMCVRDYEFQVPYGVIKTHNQRLLSIEEKPVQRYFVNAGIYVLNPEVLEFIPSGAFFDMPQLFETIIQHGKEAAVFPIREYWMDIGHINDYEKANDDYPKVFNKSEVLIEA
jgi:dTDP-glucose pyrophosphorylase